MWWVQLEDLHRDRRFNHISPRCLELHAEENLRIKTWQYCSPDGRRKRAWIGVIRKGAFTKREKIAIDMKMAEFSRQHPLTFTSEEEIAMDMKEAEFIVDKLRASGSLANSS